MEKLQIDYSFKNIPVPEKSTYIMKLIEKVESVVKRMRWRAHFFLDSKRDSNGQINKIQSSEQEPNNQHFGFKSRKCPGQCKEMEPFENDLLNLVSSIQFNEHLDPFQKKLKTDISKIKRSPNMFLFADKTNNVYELNSQQHEKLLMENITKTYKKAPPRLNNSINLEAKSIATNMKIADRVECLAKKPAYITLKDHKENFRSKPTCRLINPSKNELGKVSKQILENINKRVVNALHINQWKDTAQVIRWFESIENKNDCSFVQLDIKEFYPSISENTLDRAIEFAQSIVDIPPNEIRTIKHCRKSLLFNNGEPWKKKDSDSSFDVTMGSYDGAELCELIGSFILSLIASHLDKENAGLYRDDGLLLLRKFTGRQTDVLRKQIIQIFKSVGFDIEIITNLKVVDFLDVTFDLNSSTYKPFRKPSDKLLYIHKDSSHPPNILKQLPSMIAERLSRNSSTKEIFDKHKGEYEDALNKAGHKAKLLYVPKGGPKTTKTRKRNITWFNPPYSKGVTTNVAKKFLELLDKHFPPHNKLHQIFNRNTVKVSYSCTSNVGQAIKSHNKRVTQPNKTVIDPCNCRNKDECPLDGKCRVSNAIYKCVVSAENTPEKCYIGLASGEWKSRYANHKKSFNHRTYSKDTKLSQYVWSLKDKNIQSPTIRWSIIKTAPSYSNTSKKCPLCLNEKLGIIRYKDSMELLNRRHELISTCRHSEKYLLSNYKSGD